VSATRGHQTPLQRLNSSALKSSKAIGSLRPRVLVTPSKSVDRRGRLFASGAISLRVRTKSIRPKFAFSERLNFCNLLLPMVSSLGFGENNDVMCLPVFQTDKYYVHASDHRTAPTPVLSPLWRAGIPTAVRAAALSLPSTKVGVGRTLRFGPGSGG